MKKIELNKEYTYKEICECMNWQESGGNKKKAQIKAIEEAYEFYHPINPKTHKPKKSYLFTKQIKVVHEIKRTDFKDEEFDYLLKYMLSQGYKRNDYYQRGFLMDVYVNNSTIYSVFGLNPYVVLEGINNDFVDTIPSALWDYFNSIVLETVKSFTISRICRRFKFPKNSMPKGILRAYKKVDKRKSEKVILIPDNELLPLYNEREKELLKEYEFRTIAEAINKNKYFIIQEHIKAQFEKEGKYEVTRVNKITISDEFYEEIKKINFAADALVKQYQLSFRNVVLNALTEAVNNRIKEVKEYKFKLSDEYKKLLKECLLKFEEGVGNYSELIKK